MIVPETEPADYTIFVSHKVLNNRASMDLPYLAHSAQYASPLHPSASQQSLSILESYHCGVDARVSRPFSVELKTLGKEVSCFDIVFLLQGLRTVYKHVFRQHEFIGCGLLLRCHG